MKGAFLALFPNYFLVMMKKISNGFAVILFVVVLSMIGNSCLADQKDPRLPELFERLKLATDAKTAQLTASDIWRIWLEKPDNERLSRLLTQGTEQMNEGVYLKQKTCSQK